MRLIDIDEMIQKLKAAHTDKDCYTEDDIRMASKETTKYIEIGDLANVPCRAEAMSADYLREHPGVSSKGSESTAAGDPAVMESRIEIRQWNSPGRKLPKDGQEVLIAVNGIVTKGYYIEKFGGRFQDVGHVYPKSYVTAWAPVHDCRAM